MTQLIATGVALGHAVLPIVVPLVVDQIKKYVASLPKQYVPIVAIAVGAVLDSAIVYLSGGTSWGAYGAVAGLAGIGVRELKKQLYG
jgi:hypothetical protein